MKRYSMYLRLCIACVVSLWTGSFSLQAQGFYSPIHHTIGEFYFADYKFPGNGYQVQMTYDPNINEYKSYFGTLNLDAVGHEIGWDSAFIEYDEYSFCRLLPENNVILAHTSLATAPATWDVYKLSLGGDTLWHTELPKTLSFQWVLDVQQNAVGDIYMTGYEASSPSPSANGDSVRFFLVKFSNTGSLLWEKNEPINGWSAGQVGYIELSFAVTTDQGCLSYLAYPGSDSVLVRTLSKFNSDGTLSWSIPIERRSSISQKDASGAILALHVEADSITHSSLEKRNSAGQLLWSKNLNEVFNKASLQASVVTSSASGDIWIEGTEFGENAWDGKVFFARLNPDGSLIWKKNYPYFDQKWHGFNTSISVTPDNGLIVTGSFDDGSGTGFVLKITPNGDIYPWKIQGKVAIDNNVNCLVDPGEQAPVDWKVKLSSADLDLFTTVDSVGDYQMTDIPTGDYQLSVVMPSNLWESCPDSVAVSLLDTAQTTVTQDFAIQTIADCPFMTVDISTPILRRCMNTSYFVNYCNLGTIAAENAAVDVVFDPLFTFQSATIPVTQSGDTLHFALGSVPALGCGSFHFEVYVGCAAELGQTLCVQAHISPDTICNPAANWTGATLEASGRCDADSIRFQLRNVGNAASSTGLKFIVIDDHVITRESAIPVLNPAQSIWVSAPSNGDTWRFIADQEPNHPFEEIPNVGVEGCGTGSSGGQTFGFLMQFPNQDGNPFTDEDCHTVVGSYDPNDKSAVPQGVHEAHEIAPNQSIEYMIRFQNTGTDTAFTVVLRDTLDPALNVASLRPGAASHPCQWTLNGQNILTVTFDNILLPDSFVNEAASHGFFQFKIDQKRDNPNQTHIENRAGIYFDFNAVVLTNTVFHTVKKDLLPTFEAPALVGLPMLQLLPNPAVDQTLVWSDKPLHNGQSIRVTDLYGRVVRDVPVTGPQVWLQRNGLPTGVYLLGLMEKGKRIAGGKVVWVNP